MKLPVFKNGTEFKRIFFFLLIGGSSLVATWLGFFVISRFLWPNGPKTIQFILVGILVSWGNYEGNRLLTFRAGARSVGGITRFILVAGLTTTLNSLLFSIGHDVLHLYDLVIIPINAALVAVMTFTLHKYFTFHATPWRWTRKQKSVLPESGARISEE